MSRVRALVYGRPGAYASALKWKAYAKAVGCGVFAAGAWFAYRWGAAWWVVGAWFLAGVYGVEKFRGEAARAAAGVRTEKRGLRVARRLVSAVVCGVKPEYGGDLDLVLVGPQLVVVEMKTGRGVVEVFDDGRIRAGGRTMPGRPVVQAARAARNAARMTGRRVASVVCVADMEGVPLRVTRREGVTWVCSLRDLPRVVSALPHEVHPAEVDSVVYALLGGGRHAEAA